MSAGTLTLTNNSAAVSGSGTAFTTELEAGDFAVVTVGGIPYTLPVKTVNSNTSLTLVSNFTGPTQSGAAWSAVPRVALNMVTAALVAQSAEALRGLNYDKQNWQQVFSGTGTITVKLPDGTTFSGPAWSSFTASLNEKAAKGANSDITSLSGLTTPLSISQGGTGSTTADGARARLGLGSAATANVTTSGIDAATGLVMTIGSGGWMETKGAGWSYTGPLSDLRRNSIFYAFSSTMSGTFLGGNHHVMNLFGYIDNTYGNQLAVSLTGRVGIRSIANNVVGAWKEFWTTGNTTVDSSGSIKQASPIIKLFKNGSFKLNTESEGCTVTRLGTGEYLIEGCSGLNADAAWGGIDGGFDVPTDRNKQPLIWLDYEVNADGSILVKTYHRTHPTSPAFARNEIDDLADGDPVDIPADQFVSVRVEMPASSIWNQRQADIQQ